MVVHMYFWQTCSVQKDLSVHMIFIWLILYPVSHMSLSTDLYLCNCHLESGLTYLLKSLGSCSPSNKFTMYFTINSAFNHYMSIFGLSSNDMSPKQLLTHEPIFDIFLNDTSKPMLLSNYSSPVLPLNPPDTLLKLFQSINSRSANSPNSPFFPIVRHTSNENPRKGSFLTSASAHIMYLTTSCVLCAYWHLKYILLLNTRN